MVYVGYTQVYKSTTAGGNWQRISEFTGVTSYLRHIDVSPADSRFIVAANDNQVVVYHERRRHVDVRAGHRR